MKAISLNRKSWHYWTATKLGCYDWPDEDFCKYIRHVVAGIMVAGVLALIAGTILYSALRLAYSALMCPFAKQCTFGHFELTVVISVLAVAAVVGLVFLYGHYLEKKRERRYAILHGKIPEPKPSFLVLAYRSFKDKVCFRVHWDGKSEAQREQEVNERIRQRALDLGLRVGESEDEDEDDVPEYPYADDEDDPDEEPAEDQGEPPLKVKPLEHDESEGGHAD